MKDPIVMWNRDTSVEWLWRRAGGEPHFAPPIAKPYLPAGAFCPAGQPQVPLRSNHARVAPYVKSTVSTTTRKCMNLKNYRQQSGLPRGPTFAEGRHLRSAANSGPVLSIGARVVRTPGGVEGLTV